MYFLFLIFACSLFANPLQVLEKREKLITREQIQQRLEEVGMEITDAYGKKGDIAVLILMKGGLCIGADLIRAIDLPLTVDFVRTKSYQGKSRGSLTVLGLENLDLKGKDVLIIDDIFDSGVSLFTVLQEVEKMEPKSVSSAVALVKRVDRTITYQPDFVLFEIPDRFVVGYGMDYDEYGRSLADIYALD